MLDAVEEMEIKTVLGLSKVLGGVQEMTAALLVALGLSEGCAKGFRFLANLGRGKVG